MGVTVLLAGVVALLALPKYARPQGIGLRWQVPRGRRLQRLGRNGTFFVWGGLLGTGVLTIIPHAVVLLLPAAVIAVGSPGSAMVAGGLYGVTRATLAGLASSRGYSEPSSILDSLEPLRQRLVRASFIMVPVALIVLLAAAVVGSNSPWLE